jgi:hypothetical protein
MAVFMGAYFPWDGLENARIAKAHGFTYSSDGVEGSIGSYENLDNLQTGIHDRLRWLKFGYDRADDIASSYIRRGLRSRAWGVATVKWRPLLDYYLGVPYGDILANIGVTTDEFARICERFTNRPVVEWASRPESFQCFSGMDAAAQSRESNSVTAASAA